VRTRSALLVVLAAAVTVTATAAGGPVAAKQRVAIVMTNLPDGRFVLTPLENGAVKSDSGTTSVAVSGPTAVMQGGQAVEIFHLTFTLTGKRGTLTLRERNEWVDAGGPYVGRGSWKLSRGTGEYAQITATGRGASAGLKRATGAWFERDEGYFSAP
jgi:hypothetical protein